MWRTNKYDSKYAYVVLYCGHTASKVANMKLEEQKLVWYLKYMPKPRLAVHWKKKALWYDENELNLLSYLQWNQEHNYGSSQLCMQQAETTISIENIED